VISFRAEDAQISESMSQYINDDVVVDLKLEFETSLLQPFVIQNPTILVDSIPVELKETSHFG
jgi:hypothetical protein